MNTLLINPGRRNYLVNYFVDVSKKYNCKIFLIDPNKNSPSFQASKKTKNFVSPECNQKEKFINFLRKFTNKHKIKIIFPLSEHELEILSKEKKYYEKKNINVVVSEYKTIQVCQNKIKSYKFFKEKNIGTPEVINIFDIKKKLPVIMKERKGNSSKNQLIIKDKKSVPINPNKKYFFQKYLKLPEYGMDILNDLNGKFLHVTVKKKISIRSGDTDSAIVVNPKYFIKTANLISKNLKHIGNLDVDFLHDGKNIFILDLNPRFGGSYPFTHEFGYNYIEKIFDLILYNRKKISFKKFKDKKNFFSKGITIHKYL